MTKETDIGTLVLTNGRDRTTLVLDISYKDSIAWCADVRRPDAQKGWDVAWVDSEGDICLWPMWYPQSRDDSAEPLEYRTIYSLMEDEYPCLVAFRVLNDSLSCSAQSAPGCEALFNDGQWQEIEIALGNLSVSDFVFMAHGHYFDGSQEAQDRHHRLWALPAFKEWASTWV